MTSPTKKLILVSPKNRTVHNFRGELVKDVVASGYEVVVTGPNREDVDKIEELGARFVEIPLEKSGLSVKSDLSYLWQLRKLFRRERPEIVFGYTIKPVVYGTIAAKLAGVHWVAAMVTGVGYAFIADGAKARFVRMIVSTLYRIAFAAADVVIFQNPDDEKEFTDRGLVRRLKTRLVNGSGVNMEKFQPADFPEQLTFFMLARILRSKGVREYLSAAKIVKQRHPQVRFMLLGAIENQPDSMTYEDIEPYVEDGTVEYFGETPDVESFYRQSSVFVLPSYREGTPRTVLEAMAMGRPIITSDAPGCRQTVFDGRNGYLVPVGDAAELENKMCSFVENPGAVASMGAESHAVCKERFDVKEVNPNMLKHLGIKRLDASPESVPLKRILDVRVDLRHHLYVQGFLMTNADLDQLVGQYPIYTSWSKVPVGDYSLWLHERHQAHIVTRGGITVFMVGHAYDPFSMTIDEEEILERVAAGLEHSIHEGLAIISQLTGVFFFGWLIGDELRFMLDATGMQYACYGLVEGQLYITSHMQLVGDICQLEQDAYVKRLKSYRWYPLMMGNYLPGNLTAFSELKRVIPNTYVQYVDREFQIERFFPSSPMNECKSDAEYQQLISEAAQIMRNTMSLISKKWPKPAISLTGGVDSGMTFAAANGFYERFTTFTYVAMAREAVDAAAAITIAEEFGVPHVVVEVPDDNREIKDFDLYKQILMANSGDIGPLKDDDTRKKIVLMQSELSCLEVKSWISELARAYAYKYFGRTRMPSRFSPRNYTSMFKIVLANRRLVIETDRYFKDYLTQTKLPERLFNYDQSDFFMWKMMHSGKEGLNIGSMRFGFDITIPFNNRRLLTLALGAPLSMRLSDQLMEDITQILNPELLKMGIRVVNVNQTELRKKIINLYFMLNSRLPF